jgi:hypothetical protein
VYLLEKNYLSVSREITSPVLVLYINKSNESECMPHGFSSTRKIPSFSI